MSNNLRKWVTEIRTCRGRCLVHSLQHLPAQDQWNEIKRNLINDRQWWIWSQTTDSFLLWCQSDCVCMTNVNFGYVMYRFYWYYVLVFLWCIYQSSVLWAELHEIKILIDWLIDWLIDKWLISGVWLYRNQYIEHCWCLIQAFSRALNNEVSETEAGLPTDTDDDIRRKSHASVFLHTTRKERYCNAYTICVSVKLFCSVLYTSSFRGLAVFSSCPLVSVWSTL